MNSFLSLPVIEFSGRRILGYALWALLLFGLSYLGYIVPLVGWVVFWVLVVATLFFAFTRIEMALGLLLFELVIGSKGYLFSFPFAEQIVSLRLALFLMVMIGWAWHVLREKRLRDAQSGFLLWYVIFVIFLVFGGVWGLLWGNAPGVVFADLNGYLFWGLALVLVSVPLSTHQLSSFVSVFLGGMLGVSLFTGVIFADFFFFHQEARPDLAQAVSTELSISDEDGGEDPDKISQSVGAKSELGGGLAIRTSPDPSIPLVYRWLQDTGTAEVAYLSGRVFRVFLVGHFFHVIGALLIWVYLVGRHEVREPHRRMLMVLGLVFAATVLLSLSRSLWLGLLAGGVVSLGFMTWRRAIQVVSLGLIGLLVLGSLTAVVAPDVVESFAVRVQGVFSPNEEGASTNRINLLGPLVEGIGRSPIVGNGFGETIEYDSVVPEKQGRLRVYLSEWTYLDVLLKIGVVGLASYLVVVGWLVWRLWVYYRMPAPLVDRQNLRVHIEVLDFSLKQSGRRGIVGGLLVGIVAFLVLNVTTPFLNHPIGIGFLLICLGVARVLYEEYDAVKHFSHNEGA